MLHGIPITTRATLPALDEAVRALLGPVTVEAPRHADMPAGIAIHLEPGGEISSSPPVGARTWLAAGPLRLLTDGRDVYLLLDGRLMGTYSSADRRITAWIPPTLTASPDFIGQMIVLPLLMEAVRADGFVSLHAAALAHNGRAALFPAASGAGKTTITLALLRAGFRLLSDDCPLLRRAEGGIVVHAFAEPLHVMPKASAYFPELCAPLRASAPGKFPGEFKVALDPVSVYGKCVIQQCPPGAILFPAISQEDRTRLEPLAAPDALLRLLNLAMPSASRLHLREQLELLGDLVSAAPCYTLATGRDFERLPGCVRAVLEG